MMMSAKQTPGRGAEPGFARRWRDHALLAVLLLLVLGGIAGLAAATGWQETLAQLGRLGPIQILALLLLSLANYALRGLRWHLFAGRLGLPTGLRANLRHFLGGFAMSVTPGRVGELVRMRWIGRETGWPFERTAPLVLADRASDLTALAVLLALALTMTASGIRGAVPVALLALIFAFVATRPALLIALANGGHRLSGRRLARFFARGRRAARSLRRFSSPGVMTLAALVGAGGWLAEGFAFWLLLDWMGAEIGVAAAIAVFMFATLAGGLTGAPGGVGGAEAALVALLSLRGVPLEIALPATAVIRLTTLWFAIAIGAAVFPLAERASLRGRNALETH